MACSYMRAGASTILLIVTNIEDVQLVPDHNVMSCT